MKKKNHSLWHTAWTLGHSPCWSNSPISSASTTLLRNRQHSGSSRCSSTHECVCQHTQVYKHTHGRQRGMDFKCTHAFSLNNVSCLPAQSRTVPSTTGITMTLLTMCLLAGLLVCAMLVLLAMEEVRGAETSEVLLFYTQSCLYLKLPLSSDLGSQHAFPNILRPDPSHSAFHVITWAFL